MSSRTIIVVLLAVACGTAAAVLALQFNRRPAPVAEETQSVLTAAINVERGQVLDAKMLKLSNFKKQDVPEGALEKIDDAVGRTATVPMVKGEVIVAGKLVKTEMLPVVTAVDNLPRGQVLDAKMLKISNYQKQDVPKGALTKVDDAFGRTVIVSLEKGEAIVTGKLAEKDTNRVLAADVPDGMRAITINMPHLAADVADFIVPHNHVDVLLTTGLRGKNDQTDGGITTTLLQNVEIVAVAQTREASDEGKLIPNDIKLVTLLVTPDQAATVNLAMNMGILHLALRNPNDDRQVATRPATMSDLSFIEEKPKGPQVEPGPAVQQTKYTEIHTLRGLEPGTVRVALPR